MKKLTLRNYLGYASGDLANNLAFSLQALFLLIYYTNVVGLNPAAHCDDVPCRTSVGCLRRSRGRAPGRPHQIAVGEVQALPAVCLAAAPVVKCGLVQCPELRQHDRQVRLRLCHLRPAGLPVLPDQYPVRFSGYRDDPGSGGALAPGDLALSGTDLRHFGSRRGDCSSNHPVQDPARSASDVPDNSDHRVRRHRVCPLPVLFFQHQGAGSPSSQSRSRSRKPSTLSGRTGRC